MNTVGLRPIPSRATAPAREADEQRQQTAASSSAAKG